MTIISMIIVVLYFAFSIGVRAWSSKNEPAEDIIRLEAAVRLIEEDFRQIVPYTMFWEKGEISLFAGATQCIFYVTRNGMGALSGAGAGLFFATLFTDHCTNGTGRCLFLNKTPFSSMEFVEEVNFFKTLGDFQRKNYVPRTQTGENAILVLEGIDEAGFSFSSQEYVPFGGIKNELPENRHFKESQLEKDQWIENKLPGQIRFAFTQKNKPWIIHSPVEKL